MKAAGRPRGDPSTLRNVPWVWPAPAATAALHATPPASRVAPVPVRIWASALLIASVPVLLVVVLGPRAADAHVAQEQRGPWRQGPEHGPGLLIVLVDTLLSGAEGAAEALLHSLQLQLFALQGERPGAREWGGAPDLQEGRGMVRWWGTWQKRTCGVTVLGRTKTVNKACCLLVQFILVMGT